MAMNAVDLEGMRHLSSQFRPKYGEVSFHGNAMIGRAVETPWNHRSMGQRRRLSCWGAN
jgi:hypothetical protein